MVLVQGSGFGVRGSGLDVASAFRRKMIGRRYRFGFAGAARSSLQALTALPVSPLQQVRPLLRARLQQPAVALRPTLQLARFHATDLDLILHNRGIRTLIVCGVTLEVCVHTTVREANDRGYRCVVLADGCASYFPEFHEMGLKMIKAQGGIFGWVSDSGAVLQALSLEIPRTAAAGEL